MIERTHLQQSFLILLAIGAMGLCYVMVEPFIGPIVAAGAIAILFYPVHASMVRSMPRRKGLASGLSLLLVIALVVIPFIWIVVSMSREVAGVYGALKSKTVASGSWTEFIIEAGSRPLIYFGIDPGTANDEVRQFLSDRLATISSALLKAVQSVVSNVAVFLFNATVAFFVLFYLFRDGKRLLERARKLLPLEQVVFDRLVNEVGRSVLANVYGVGAVAVAQGATTGLLFWAVGVHSPVIWGVIAGFCSMIPIIGPPIVWVPVAVTFAVTGSWGKAAVVTAVGAGVIGTIDNILRPWIVSGRVKLHPLLVFISLLGGAQAFGFLGLFIGPAALSVTFVIFEFLRLGLPGAGGREQAVVTEDIEAG